MNNNLTHIDPEAAARRAAKEAKRQAEHNALVSRLRDDLETELVQWAQRRDDYAPARSRALFDEWLDSVRSAFLEKARDEYRTIKEPPRTFEDLARRHVMKTIREDHPYREQAIEEAVTKLVSTYAERPQVELPPPGPGTWEIANGDHSVKR